MKKLKDYDNNKYTTIYRKNHPDKVLRWRINQYARFLSKMGWTVTPPETVECGEEA